MKTIWDCVRLTPREQTKLDRNLEDVMVAIDVDRPATTHTAAYWVWAAQDTLRWRRTTRDEVNIAFEQAMGELAMVNDETDAEVRQALAKIKTALKRAWATLTMRSRWRVAAAIEREVGEAIVGMMIAPAVVI